MDNNVIFHLVNQNIGIICCDRRIGGRILSEEYLEEIEGREENQEENNDVSGGCTPINGIQLVRVWCSSGVVPMNTLFSIAATAKIIGSHKDFYKKCTVTDMLDNMMLHCDVGGSVQDVVKRAVLLDIPGITAIDLIMSRKTVNQLWNELYGV